MDTRRYTSLGGGTLIHDAETGKTYNYDFGNSPEELQKVIWELSVEIRNLQDRVAELESFCEAPIASERVLEDKRHKRTANMAIRRALLDNNMAQVDLADLMNVPESTLSRKLRKELPEKEQKRILWIINNREKYREMTQL